MDLKMTEKSVLWACSSYLKNGALEDLLDSIIEHGYDREADILICDDGEGHARDLVKMYGLLYTTGDRGGIGHNKNRGIKYFLDNPQYKELVLIDDDVIMTRPGLMEEFRRTGSCHVTGYLGSYEDGLGFTQDTRIQLSGNPFFKDFPVKGQTDTGLIYCLGSQGFLMYFTREIVEKAKYFPVGPGHYGYEHSLYSNTINRLLGLYIDWFPILYKTPKYCVGNYSWPNQYEAKPELNHKWWLKKRVDIMSGVNYINKHHGIPEEEVIECLKLSEPSLG